MTTSSTIECTVHFHRRGHGARKELQARAEPLPPPERIPRLARLLALAHRCETLLQAGVVKDYATLARLGHVSRARICQIVSLLQLAPDIQEEILFLGCSEPDRRPRCPRDPIRWLSDRSVMIPPLSALRGDENCSLIG